MDQTEVQRLSQTIKSLESKVKELEATVIRLESENKELFEKVAGSSGSGSGGKEAVTPPRPLDLDDPEDGLLDLDELLSDEVLKNEEEW